ncbi:MAG: hypothetical protein GY740_15875, partial [Gammaproteobacteria bacterium]|nr:hypothetical protein [Gammaproteobacteria bacterium]
MAYANDETLAYTDQQTEQLFDEAANTANEDLARATMRLRNLDFIPSADGEFNQRIRDIDAEATKCGGVALLKKYFQPQTATESCITSSIRAKLAKYLPAYAAARRAIFPTEDEWIHLVAEYNTRTHETRTYLETELRDRQLAARAQEETDRQRIADGNADVVDERQDEESSETPYSETRQDPLAIDDEAAESARRDRLAAQQQDNRRVEANRTLETTILMRNNNTPTPPEPSSIEATTRRLVGKMERDTNLLSILAKLPIVDRKRLTQLMQSYTPLLGHAHDEESGAAVGEEINNIVRNITYPELSTLQEEENALPGQPTDGRPLTSTSRSSGSIAPTQNAHNL